MIQQAAGSKRLRSKLFAISTRCRELVGLQRSSRENPWCTQACSSLAKCTPSKRRVAVIFGSLVTSLPRAHRIELIGQHGCVVYCCDDCHQASRKYMWWSHWAMHADLARTPFRLGSIQYMHPRYLCQVCLRGSKLTNNTNFYLYPYVLVAVLSFPGRSTVL